MTITAQLDLAFPDAPGFKGQGWSTQETVMAVRWLFADPDAWAQAMAVARQYPGNPHTVADTLHEQIVPRPELSAIAAAGGDPARVNWLEIAHELIERRNDPLPVQEHALSISVQALETITSQILLASTAAHDKAHATASATAKRTAAAHAKAKLAGEKRNEHGEWTKVGGLVAHQDGTVTGNAGKVQVGTLAHENGKWVAHHADGSVSKHAVKASALKAMASRHNKAGTAQPPAPVPVKAEPGKTITQQVAEAPKPGPPAPAVTPPPAAADESAAKLADSLNTMAALGGKSTQKAVLKKNSLADLQGMDAEYTRRGAASGKISAAHQLVKDELASRGATPLPAPSPDEMKAARAAVTAHAVSGPATKQDLISAWSTSYRYTGKTEAKDKRIADFATEMHRLLSTNKQPGKCGPGCQDAHKFLGMVDHDATPQKGELQRGLSLSTAKAQQMFQPGKTMDMPVASWTSDDHTASGYAKGQTEIGKTKVVLHAAPGAKGLDIADMSIWQNEKEVVTGGRFSVEKVQTEGGVMNVYLTQQDFSAH